MLKTKKIISIVMIIIILLSLMQLKVMAISGDIKDYNDISTLDSKYGYGQLIATKDTRIEKTSNNTTTLYSYNNDNDFNRYGLYENDVLELRITNCTIDKSGNICDVVVRVDNIKKFSFIRKAGSVFNEYFESNDIDGFIHSVLQISLNYNGSNLIAFWLNSCCASVDFNMTYYVTGTNTKANIDYNASLLGDMDAKGNSYTRNDEEGGEEFVKLLNNNGTFYYHKNYYLKQTKSGIGISTSGDVNSSTGITEKEFTNKRIETMGDTSSFDLYSTAFMLQELNSAQYSFHYRWVWVWFIICLCISIFV